MKRRNVSYVTAAFAMASIVLLGTIARAVTVDTNLPVRVNHPKTLDAWELPAERTAIGEGYKPCLAMLPNGELIMVALFQDRSDGKLHEWLGLWRSSDEGKTWSDRVRVEREPGQDLLGREHWITVVDDGTPDGVLLTTCHLLKQDTHNPDGSLHCYVSRSTDGGKTWTQTRVGPEGWSNPKMEAMTTRNVVEMPNGKLLFGVADFHLPGREAYIWTSEDQGETWQQSAQLSIPSYTNYQGKTMQFKGLGGYFSEAWLHLDAEGHLTNFVRVGPPTPLFPMSDKPPTGDDRVDRLMTTVSTDGGLTWGAMKDCGGYAMHYPRILRLNDGRWLMTLTQRGIIYPVGLQAVLGDDDGKSWDFENDRIVIEGRTPWGGVSGGGFGNTVQLKDGSLVSCYSYQNSPTFWDYKDNTTQVEVVRWRLSEAK